MRTQGYDFGFYIHMRLHLARLELIEVSLTLFCVSIVCMRIGVVSRSLQGQCKCKRNKLSPCDPSQGLACYTEQAADKSLCR